MPFRRKRPSGPWYARFPRGGAWPCASRELDLSESLLPFTKVVAANDGIATPEMIDATRDRLPAGTRWIEIEGGNHLQFGHYGHQLFDGTATISRERQQQITREALLATFRN
jgi:hypothetical protein